MKSTAEEASRDLRALNRDLGRMVKTVIWRRSRATIDPLKKAYRSHGIGHAMWGDSGAEPSGKPRLVVTFQRKSDSIDATTGEGRFERVLRSYGMAALIEEGGKTKRHQIRARLQGRGSGKQRGRLAFIGSRGNLARPWTVDHPGTPVAAMHQHSAIAPALEAAIVLDLEAGTRTLQLQHGFE